MLLNNLKLFLKKFPKQKCGSFTLGLHSSCIFNMNHKVVLNKKLVFCLQINLQFTNGLHVSFLIITAIYVPSYIS